MNQSTRSLQKSPLPTGVPPERPQGNRMINRKKAKGCLSFEPRRRGEM
ncbi:MAG: hypothetical protein [Olavius algarvensis Gamma 1 endosymbiont]|nr:MAG: hypothetical protein [Olavius algarvensis Gamma 1 endosymbiont]